MDTPVRLGDIVRRKRKCLGLSQTELGDQVGMSQRWISTLERGETDVPRRVHLHALANALELDVAELYVAADLARDEARARLADDAVPVSDDDLSDPLYGAVFLEMRKLSPDDLNAVREIIRRMTRDQSGA